MISGPSSYLGTIDDFVSHWSAVNADAAAGTGLKTRDGKTRENLIALRTQLDTALGNVEDRLNDKEIARATLENTKRNILGRAHELVRRLRGVLPEDSPYLATLPDLPQQSSAEEVFVRPMRDCDKVWVRASEEGVEFELAGGFGPADFTALFASLQASYSTLHGTVKDLELARAKRNALQNDVKTLLSGYRPAVEGLFPPDSPLVVTLPVIYASSSRTPKPVQAAATYDAAEHKAVITFTESADDALDHYELRAVPGPEYTAEDEQVIATLAKGAAPREFRTDFSLASPGMAASFKVYVVLTTGNEAGSEAVTVERPA